MKNTFTNTHLSWLKSALFLIMMVVVLSGSVADNSSTTYYISPEGDDDHSGLSAEEAWRSIEKVNRSLFQPGDALLFMSDGVWEGQLLPQGNGEPGKPITLGIYGEGARPVINMGSKEGAGVKLVNQSWWEISGIEITSGSPPELGVQRMGIVSTVEGDDKHIEHIVIRDCYIHDIWGQVGGDKSGIAIYVGQYLLGPRQGKNCTTDDVVVENNTIQRVDKIGIAINGRNDIVVRGNHMENLGGDGIIVYGANQGLIEYNIADRTCLRSGDPDLDMGGEDWWPHTAAIWIAGCTETIMQFNEVYNTGRQPGNGDGFAYDFDFACRKCILQYNYSANGHGLLLIMNRTYDNIARYNISQNDQTHLVQIHGNTADGNIIHNNVFYVDHSTVDIDYYCGMEQEKDKSKLGVTFINNIFYAGAQGRFRSVYSHGNALERKFIDTLNYSSTEGGPVFRKNCYFGPWLKGLPEDQDPLLADPLFMGPGTGGTGPSSLQGYQLQAGSPCINAGSSVGAESELDYYGNPIDDGLLDIGIFEH